MTEIQRKSVKLALSHFLENGDQVKEPIKKTRNTKNKKEDPRAITLEKEIYKLCVKLSNDNGQNVSDLYPKIAYEKLGELSKDANLYDKILEDVTNSVLLWDSVAYSNYRQREHQNAADQAKGIAIKKGEFKCKKPECRSNECYYYQSQTRSVDEGGTTFVICVKCGGTYHFG